MTPDRITLTPRDAADLIGISEDLIRRAIRAGDLATVPGPMVAGRRIRRTLIARDELERWATA